MRREEEEEGLVQRQEGLGFGGGDGRAMSMVSVKYVVRRSVGRRRGGRLEGR